MSDANQKKDPTAAEAMLFFYILKNLRNKADIDWDAVAQDSQLKNGVTARARFGQIKKKLGISSEPSPSPKKTAPPSVATPTKVTKKGGRSGTKAQSRTPTSARSIVKKEEEEEEEEQSEEQTSAQSSRGPTPTFPSPPPGIKREPGHIFSGKDFDALMRDGDPF